MAKSNYQPTVTMNTLHNLARVVCKAKTLDAAIRTLEGFNATIAHQYNVKAGLGWTVRTKKRGTWKHYVEKLIAALKARKTAFKVFKLDGNTKLPFAAFSTLPQYTCPGAGDCLNWCYSFTAWRYPAAFLRQLQNTLYLFHCPELIEREFLKLKQGITVRLYVDGDFDSTKRVEFWMSLIAKRADLDVYGYSKSWQEILEYASYNTFPGNYTMNISSGSKHADNAEMVDSIGKLSISRGHFVGVKIDTTGLPKGFKRYQSKEYHNRVREAMRGQYGKATVSCPGECGSCGNGKHWCGDNQKLHGITIGIGIH